MHVSLATLHTSRGTSGSGKERQAIFSTPGSIVELRGFDSVLYDPPAKRRLGRGVAPPGAPNGMIAKRLASYRSQPLESQPPFERSVPESGRGAIARVLQRSAHFGDSGPNLGSHRHQCIEIETVEATGIAAQDLSA